MRKVGATGGSRETQARKTDIVFARLALGRCISAAFRFTVEKFRVAAGEFRQCRRRLGGQSQKMVWPHNVGLRRCLLLVHRRKWRCLSDDQVHVCAAHAKCADSSEALFALPGDIFGRNLEGPVVPRDVPVEVRAVAVRRNRLVLQRQHHFHQTCDSGRRIQVSDVGFHGTQVERFGSFFT